MTDDLSRIEDGVKEVGGRVEDVDKRLRKLENWAKVLGTLAVIFGISGGIGGKFLSEARSDVNDLRTQLTTARDSLVAMRVSQEEELRDFVDATWDSAAARVAQAVQSGVAQIGDHGSLRKRVTIRFPTPFPQPPAVVASTIADPARPDADDVFAVSIPSVTATEFVVLVQRVDQSTGWGQHLRLGWVAAVR